MQTGIRLGGCGRKSVAIVKPSLRESFSSVSIKNSSHRIEDHSGSNRQKIQAIDDRFAQKKSGCRNAFGTAMQENATQISLRTMHTE